MSDCDADTAIRRSDRRVRAVARPQVAQKGVDRAFETTVADRPGRKGTRLQIGYARFAFSTDGRRSAARSLPALSRTPIMTAHTA